MIYETPNPSPLGLPAETPETSFMNTLVTAETYDNDANESGWDSPMRAQQLIADRIVPGAMVLDIGVGTGEAVKGYMERGALVVGLDYDEEMLEKAQRVTGDSGDMRRADINTQLPVTDLQGQADVVQAVGVLEFANDLGAVFDQVAATLKPGGAFVFTVETLPQGELADEATKDFPEAGITVHQRSADKVRELLVRRGLIVLHDEAYDGYERGDGESGKVPYHIFLAQLDRGKE